MTRETSIPTKFLAACAVLVGVLTGTNLVAGPPPGAGQPGQAAAPRSSPAANFANFSGSPAHTIFFPSFFGYGGFGYGGYSGFYSPLYSGQYVGSHYPYMPNYWWTSAYPTADPRQEGYNPRAGYPWNSVTTLILETIPAKSRITLDGVFVGTSDTLAPFQLPMGEHTLRVEAAGYEPSEIALKVEEPVLQQLEVRLNPAGQPPTRSKPAPRQ